MVRKKEIVFIESDRRGAGVYAMRLARDWGYSIRFLTRSPDYYGDGSKSPTELADVIDVVDTFDATRILYSVDWKRTGAVLAFNDYHLVPAALAAQALSLPHASLAGLINARFKDRTRQCLANCPGNPVFDVLDLDQCDLQFKPGWGYPCVVKPVDDSGSHGVYISKDSQSLVSAIANVQKRAVNARGYTLTRRCLVEKYIEGSEFSAELFWDARKKDWFLLGFTRKIVTPPPLAFELGHIFPHSFPLELANHLESRIRQWLSKVGLRGLAAHVEFRLDGNEPFCMKINPRLGGDEIDTLTSLALTIDPIAWYLKLHLGKQIDFPASPTVSRQLAGVRFLLPDKPGCVTYVAFNNETPVGVEKVYLTHALPKTVAGDRRITDRLGYIVVVGQDAQEINNKLDSVISKVSIHYAP